MYETYLQNEREFDEKFDNILNYDEALIGVSGSMRDYNRLSRIKEMKALEKELEGEKVADGNYNCGEEGCCNPNPDDPREENSVDWQIGYNQALQLSLDKIREFISKLEK